MVMCPAPVAQITNFQTDFLIGQWTSLMHILGLHLRFLLLLCLLGGPQLLRFEVVMDLSIEVTLERDLPAAFLGRGGVVKKFIVVSVVGTRASAKKVPSGASQGSLGAPNAHRARALRTMQKHNLVQEGKQHRSVGARLSEGY